MKVAGSVDSHSFSNVFRQTSILNGSADDLPSKTLILKMYHPQPISNSFYAKGLNPINCFVEDGLPDTTSFH
jgi:hypothetical protein